MGLTFYGNAPYSFPEGLQRVGWYGFSGTPAVMFDGVTSHPGGASSGSMFSTYQPSVVSRQSIASPLLMNANYVIVGNEITMTTSITVDLPVTTSSNQVHFFVASEDYHGQSNMVLMKLESENFSLTEVGQNVLIQRTFTLDSEWIDENLRLVVIAQSQATKEILQATFATAHYAATVIVDSEPNGVNAPWRLQGPEGMDTLGEGDKELNVFFAGQYTLTWLDVPLWTAPAGGSQTQTVLEDGTITFAGQYTDGPFTTVTAGPLGNSAQSQGTAAVDFDGDGDLDLHVVIDGAPDQLLRNDGPGVFTDIASGLVADAGAGRSSAWADFNSDGFQDLYLGKFAEANVLLLGDGSGGFTLPNTIGVDLGDNSLSTMWIDYNNDGNLDLYSTAQGANSLLKSLGDLGGGFYVFTVQSGPPADLSNSNSASWTDGNLDGQLDLYIVNAFAANRFLESTPIGFNDISSSCGLADVTNGTGSAWGDLDNDGDFDLYLTNDGMADKLYTCNGDFLYSLIPGEVLGDLGHGRGVVMADLNNDMFLDIYVVRHGQADLLLINNGDMTFFRAPVGTEQADGPGQTLVSGDLDGDGSVDLFITRQGAGNVLLKNDLGAQNNWFDIRLAGSEMQPDAIGARVVLTSGGVSQTRLITGGGFMSMNSRTASFGLAQNSQVDLVEVYWPDGTTQTAGPFAANMHLQITKGQDPASPVGDDDGSALPRMTVLGKAHPNPFNPSTTIDFALGQDGPARLEVFDLNGRLVRTLVDQNLGAGSHSATWTGIDRSGRSVASGAYFYRLTAADGTVDSGRMILVK